MNLFIRLIFLFLKHLTHRNYVDRLSSHSDSFYQCDTSFTVLPTDIDINLHLTNSRYFAFMDVGRINFILKMGLLSKLLKRQWLPVVASEKIHFFRPIKPMTRIKVRTTLLGWSESNLIMEQKFISKNGKRLYAKGWIFGIFLDSKGKKIPFDDIIALLPEEIDIPHRPIPDEFTPWIQEQKASRNQ